MKYIFLFLLSGNAIANTCTYTFPKHYGFETTVDGLSACLGLAAEAMLLNEKSVVSVKYVSRESNTQWTLTNERGVK